MNHFGRIFQLSIFGESHGDMIGVVVDGVPAGIALSQADFIPDLSRRKAGGLGTTPRLETDEPCINSGVFKGRTTGSPICISFVNQNTKSKDYEGLLTHPRPSHADFVANYKYKGYQDYRGGGAFSGRLTLGLVSAGVLAKKILNNVGFETEIINLGGSKDKNEFDSILKDVSLAGDSVGGVVRVTVKQLPIGLGEPYFDSLEATISHLLFSVGGVKGVSFGVGFDGVALRGSEFNDLIIDKTGKTKTNHNGGINGGISNGNDLVINIFVKPTASIFKEQETFDFKADEVRPLKLEGRHDAAIILRAQVVLEACVAIALADAYLVSKTN